MSVTTFKGRYAHHIYDKETQKVKKARHQKNTTYCDLKLSMKPLNTLSDKN